MSTLTNMFPTDASYPVRSRETSAIHLRFRTPCGRERQHTAFSENIKDVLPTCETFIRTPESRMWGNSKSSLEAMSSTRELPPLRVQGAHVLPKQSDAYSAHASRVCRVSQSFFPQEIQSQTDSITRCQPGKLFVRPCALYLCTPFSPTTTSPRLMPCSTFGTTSKQTLPLAMRTFYSDEGEGRLL